MSARDGFEQLHQQFRPKILAYLTRLAGPDEAEDLCQEVFLKLREGCPRFGGMHDRHDRIDTSDRLDEQRRAVSRSQERGA